MLARRTSLIVLVLAAIAFPFAGVEAGSEPLRTVNSTADPGDGTCDPTECTLREALNEIGEGGLVDFFISGDPGCTGMSCTIAITAGALPEIPADVTVDALSQGQPSNGPLIIIDGAAAGNHVHGLRAGGDGVSILYVEVRNFRGAGVSMTDAYDNVIVEDSVVRGNGADGRSGIEMSGTFNTIQDTLVVDNNAEGAILGNDASTNISISGSEFVGNGGDGVRLRGTDITVAGSFFDGNGGDGLNYFAPDEVTDSEFQLTDNEITANGVGGAFVSGRGATVTGNTITGNTTNPIQFGSALGVFGDDAVVTGNFVDDNVKYGASIFGNGSEFSDNSVTGNGLTGLDIGGSAVASGNTITGNGEDGVSLTPINGTRLSDNDISSNVGNGIAVSEAELNEPGATVGALIGGEGEGNQLHNNGLAGVLLVDAKKGGPQAAGSVVHPSGVSILANSIDGNGGLGIDLSGDGVTANDDGDGDDGPNGLLNFPEMTGSNGQAIQGTACAGCMLELFVPAGDSSGHGEGPDFLGVAVAAQDGTFSASICASGLSAGTAVSATATDEDGNTSEFSLNFELLEAAAPICQNPTPTPTPTPSPTPEATPTASPTSTPSGTATATPIATPTSEPSGTPDAELLQGDVQCDGDVDTVDALQQLRDVAALETFQEDGCPAIGAVGAIFGDVDCDGDVDSVDALKVLRQVAALSVTQTEPCVDIGEPL